MIFLWVLYIFWKVDFCVIRVHDCSLLLLNKFHYIFLCSSNCLLQGSSQDLSFFLGHAQIFAHFSLLVYFCVFPSFIDLCFFHVRYFCAFVFSLLSVAGVCVTQDPHQGQTGWLQVMLQQWSYSMIDILLPLSADEYNSNSA